MGHMVWRTRSDEGVEMISAMGGARGMASMDAMRQMQQKMFTKADANGSGGLDATEFDSMVKNSSMAGKGPQGVSKEDMFKKIDGDGNGELSQAEMESAHQERMQRFQSTMQAFGPGSAASTGANRPPDALNTLLQAIGSGDGTQAKDDQAMQAGSTTDDLTAQLRTLLEKMSSAYSSVGHDAARSLMAVA